MKKTKKSCKKWHYLKRYYLKKKNEKGDYAKKSVLEDVSRRKRKCKIVWKTIYRKNIPEEDKQKRKNS